MQGSTVGKTFGDTAAFRSPADLLDALGQRTDLTELLGRGADLSGEIASGDWRRASVAALVVAADWLGVAEPAEMFRNL